MTKKIVVTSALPYANGPIHIGHMVEYIQTDIFVRFLRLIGQPVIYCCADDTHGTPIEVNAQKLGIPPLQLISETHKEHVDDFREFSISFDSYYSTNSDENRHYSDFIFKKLQEKNLIYRKDVELTYCAKCDKFLPDRYVKGRCPKCGADDQYGDVCEKCNATYDTTDLVNPFCTICGAEPERKTSNHYFFKLSECSDDLKEWLESNKNLQPEVKNYILNWIKEGLKDWDITRDGPYFGFNIPGEKNLYYYVWLDAPVGYISSTENYCKNIMKGKCTVDEYWRDGRIIHFIGKDIIYFHFLFWPAMLMHSGFSLPEDIVVHGFLTVNKEKMSKSRGTFLTAKDYLKTLDPEYLRFYFASNLSKTMSDIDLDFEDFKSSINNKLVADLGNFAYRVISFCNTNLGSKIYEFDEPELDEQLKKKFEDIRKAYSAYNFRQAVKLILEVGSIGNKYFQDNTPWQLEDEERKKQVVSFCVNLVKDIAILIKPILPGFTAKLENQLDANDLKWEHLDHKSKGSIGKGEILVKKIENEFEQFAVKDPFADLDLRTAKILEAKQHHDADNLLVLQINIGGSDSEGNSEKRQLVAGLAQHYDLEDLVGKGIVVVKNLKPAKLRGEMSAGMLLAGSEGDQVKILETDAEPGTQVRVNGIESSPKPEIKFDDFLKIKMNVEQGKPMYKGQVLKAGDKEITVKLDKGKIS